MTASHTKKRGAPFRENNLNETANKYTARRRCFSRLPSKTNLICRLSIEISRSSLTSCHEKKMFVGWQKFWTCALRVWKLAGLYVWRSKAAETEDQVSPAGCEGTDPVGHCCWWARNKRVETRERERNGTDALEMSTKHTHTHTDIYWERTFQFLSSSRRLECTGCAANRV